MNVLITMQITTTTTTEISQLFWLNVVLISTKHTYSMHEIIIIFKKMEINLENPIGSGTSKWIDLNDDR